LEKGAGLIRASFSGEKRAGKLRKPTAIGVSGDRRRAFAADRDAALGEDEAQGTNNVVVRWVGVVRAKAPTIRRRPRGGRGHVMEAVAKLPPTKLLT
jgi:hypothetical protein